MKIISWNCRGIVNGRVQRHVKELLIATKADACCLLEIRSAKADKMIRQAANLGFNNHFLVEPIGFAGGLLLFWNRSLVELEVISHSSQAIHMKVNNLPKDCFITFAYVRPNVLAKCRFWDNCKTFATIAQGSWVVMGDLNDIATEEEQWGSNSVNGNNLQRFIDAYSDCGLIDPGSTGPKFTWCRQAGNRVIQMRKLDRALFNIRAQLDFPKAKVMVLPRLFSDHNPIMFIDEAGNPPSRNSRPVRFEAAWLERDDYKLIWKEATNDVSRPIHDIISMVTSQSLFWNRNVFGNIFSRKRTLENKIKAIQSDINYASSSVLQSSERHLIKQLNDALDQEEMLWFQKSRRDWVRDGDRNTRFYHNSALIRRNRNRTRFLKVEGSWTDDPAILSSHITNFFSSLFCRDPNGPDDTLPPIDEARKISRAQADSLVRPASLDEVRKAIMGMKNFESPGPDGIPALFYQHFWNEVGMALTNMVNQALATGTVNRSLLHAYMTLIPKKETPESAADFRPITLLNVAFKVISKVLVNRMRPIMCNLIGPHQNSFLPGRSTQDNIILTQEVVHTMNRKRGKKGYMIVKVDLQKAYDSVAWSFLESTLVDFGFPRQMVELISFSLRESDISILWNGRKLPPFSPGRGLRQGDPLAPYLFNLVMERLAYEIQSKANAGRWKPTRISRGGIGISHLFFADDLMLFGETSERQANIMKECLKNFSRASGLQVNLSKSLVYCSPNVNAGTKKIIGDKLGFPLASNLGSYLGIPMLQQRVSRTTFTNVLDKMRRKLSTWKAKSLSIANRRILVQSSLSTVPTYSMHSMALPVSTCNDINKICRNFLWGHDESSRKLHTVSWSEVCKPRDAGGLGLRRARDFNLAFLTKLAWQVSSNQDKLWVRALCDKYVKDGDFLQIQTSPNSSWGWRSILKGISILLEGSRWKIGQGDSINFWHDKWLLPDELVDKIRAIPLPVTDNQVDSITWPYSTSGVVSVASAFSFVAGLDSDDTSHEWIWRLLCAEKIKIFLWKISKNGLVTNAERTRRGLAAEADCPCCGFHEESLDHIFRQCVTALECWGKSSPPTWFTAANHLPLSDWIKMACTRFTGEGQKASWSLDFPYILWHIWLARNNVVFNRVTTHTDEILRRAACDAMEHGFVTLNTDGSRKTSTRLASAGGLIRDHNGTWLVGFIANIGTTSSFVAELWGIRECLLIAKQRNFERIIVETNSETACQALRESQTNSTNEHTLILIANLSLGSLATSRSFTYSAKGINVPIDWLIGVTAVHGVQPFWRNLRRVYGIFFFVIRKV
ncbi:uncharacterized protein LOC116023586 [Ipomoea triloba]|uniref:uncharacterized protein LOC116023586 n=1 Tax=Ipomoea triloba TaxID=35885 RepID=UPI00125E7CB6|nr:uncharacterized protein LOC116023586 [Ipomoea triloba]